MTMLVAIGNFFFRFRDFLFPFALVFLLVPGPAVLEDPLHAVLLGFVVAALGQLGRGMTIGFKYIIRGGRNRRVYAQDLVTDGIYAHCRNPMYVGNLLILAGVSLASNNWTCVLVLLPLTAFIYVAIIAAEEDFLRQKFGSGFDSYCRDVPRWLPRLRGLGATFRSMEFRWRRVIVKEYGTPFGWISAICVIGALHLWQDGRLTSGEPVLRGLVIVWIVTLGAWVTARYLKKSRTLVAD
jgi:protein-S-isoprenylcysteine O-methyltransferase Ste14